MSREGFEQTLTSEHLSVSHGGGKYYLGKREKHVEICSEGKGFSEGAEYMKALWGSESKGEWASMPRAPSSWGGHTSQPPSPPCIVMTPPTCQHF